MARTTRLAMTWARTNVRMQSFPRPQRRYATLRGFEERHGGPNELPAVPLPRAGGARGEWRVSELEARGTGKCEYICPRSSAGTRTQGTSMR